MFVAKHPVANTPADALAKLCQRYHIKRLSAFGSLIRQDYHSDSDVDLLVEFEAGHTPGWEIVDIEEAFSSLFGGRKVEIVNPKYLNRHLKARVLNAAVLQYESGDGA